MFVLQVNAMQKMRESQGISTYIATGAKRDDLIKTDDKLVRNTVKFMYDKMGIL